jgi:hypothetical protein
VLNITRTTLRIEFAPEKSAAEQIGKQYSIVTVCSPLTIGGIWIGMSATLNHVGVEPEGNDGTVALRG